MARLKRQDSKLAGKSNVIPFFGEVQLDENSSFETNNIEKGNELVALKCGYVWEDDNMSEQTDVNLSTLDKSMKAGGSSLVPENANTPEDEKSNGGQIEELTPQTEETNPLEKQEEDDLSSQEEDKLEKSDARIELEGMKVAELQKLAEPFPVAEWGSLKKAELIDYLLNKL